MLLSKLFNIWGYLFRRVHFLFQETTECRAMGGEKSIESDMDQDSSDDEMYVEETSDDDDEEDEAPTWHRLEWDDGL